MPGDPTFSQTDNKYDIPSYKRICAEFGVDPRPDFCFIFGENHGLGYVFVNHPDGGYVQKKWVYPLAMPSNPSSQRFTDEGDTNEKGNKLEYIRDDQGADTQFEYFVPDTVQGLTQVGLSCINQTIKAFVYCVLGAQVNVRSGILGEGGRAKEAQLQFLVLLEDTIGQPDLAKCVQRYQLAIDEAKVRLDLVTMQSRDLAHAFMHGDQHREHSGL